MSPTQPISMTVGVGDGDDCAGEAEAEAEPAGDGDADGEAPVAAAAPVWPGPPAAGAGVVPASKHQPRTDSEHSDGGQAGAHGHQPAPAGPAAWDAIDVHAAAAERWIVHRAASLAKRGPAFQLKAEPRRPETTDRSRPPTARSPRAGRQPRGGR